MLDKWISQFRNSSKTKHMIGMIVAPISVASILYWSVDLVNRHVGGNAKTTTQSSSVRVTEQPQPRKHECADYFWDPECGLFGTVDRRVHPQSDDSGLEVSPKHRRDLSSLQQELNAKKAVERLAFQNALEKLPTGKLAFSAPSKMQTGGTELVLARIGSSDVPINALTLGMSDETERQLGLEKTKVSLHMTMTLTGSDFDITPLDTPDQLVGGTHPTTWRWEIQPHHSGPLRLHLTAIVQFGFSLKQDYTTVDRVVNVRVDPKVFIGGLDWKWILASLGGGITFLFSAFRNRAQRGQTAGQSTGKYKQPVRPRSRRH